MAGYESRENIQKRTPATRKNHIVNTGQTPLLKMENRTYIFGQKCGKRNASIIFALKLLKPGENEHFINQNYHLHSVFVRVYELERAPVQQDSSI